MGFDRGERRWQIGVSDTQAYRQFGNAVVVAVVEFLANAMRPHLAVALSGNMTEVFEKNVVDTRVGILLAEVYGLMWCLQMSEAG